MTKLFSKIDKITYACSFLGKFCVTIGGATAYSEGHPNWAAFFIALGLALIELKDQISKKQTT